jgi:hypothetical protein
MNHYRVLLVSALMLSIPGGSVLGPAGAAIRAIQI